MLHTVENRSLSALSHLSLYSNALSGVLSPELYNPTPFDNVYFNKINSQALFHSPSPSLATFPP